MAENKLDVAINEIEAKQYKYDFQIADEFKLLAETGDFSQEELEHIKAEFMLFRFMTKNDYQDKTEPRFKPVMEYTDGTVFPDYSELTPVRLNYYLARSKATSNPIMKARYLDVNFEFNKQIKREDIIDELIEAHIEAAKVEGRGNEMDSIDLLQRAFTLANDFKKTHKDTFQKTKKSVLTFLDKLQKENPRWCLELLELIAHFNKSFTKTELEHAHKVAVKGVAHYRKEEGSFMILESYIKIEHTLSSILDPAKFSPEQAAREKAQLYVDEADNRTDSLFIKQHNLLKAAQILREANLSDEAAKLNSQAETLGRLPEFTEGFKEFSFEQTIPKDVFVKLQQELASHKDKAGLIAYSANFFPSWKQAKEAGKAEQFSSISDHFSSVTFNEDNVPVAKAPDDVAYRRTMRYYDSSVAVANLFLKTTLVEVIKNGDFSYKDISHQVDKLKLINQDTYEAVSLGFKYFFKGKYYEALTILVPQIEDLLGDIVRTHGMKRYRQVDIDLVEPKMLGALLNDLERIYSKDLSRYLQYQLIDPAKVNLRNETGHGKIKLTTPNIDLKAMVVLQIYMEILVHIKAVEKV